MEAIFNDNGLLEYTKAYVSKPPTFDAQDIAQWKKDAARARRIILEAIQDHIF